MVLECYDLLKQMESRPGMWTGETTLRSIQAFLSGYYYALSSYHLLPSRFADHSFFDWVAEKLGYPDSTAGWVNMIVAHCMGFKPEKTDWQAVLETHLTHEQHLKSIHYFYHLLEEFKKEVEE